MSKQTINTARSGSAKPEDILAESNKDDPTIVALTDSFKAHVPMEVFDPILLIKHN